VSPKSPATRVRRQTQELKQRLRPYGLADALALCSFTGEPLARGVGEDCLHFDEAAAADVLLNQRYGAPAAIVQRFRRSALLDIDPGLLQTWMRRGWLEVQPHDAYFTIGEGLGTPGARSLDLGIAWRKIRPCVALDWWSPAPPEREGAFTTLTHWYAAGGASDSEDAYCDDKRSGFLPYLDLPGRTTQVLELALDLAAEDAECENLKRRGWRVQGAASVAATPWDYHRYVQGSRGEFSCAKPSYVRLGTGWLSDRTVCYLASGKPAVVQHTGPSSLPESAGLFRFRDLDEAAHALETIAENYEREQRRARELAEEFFDAQKVVSAVLASTLS
jgi:hypothetical protein